MAKLPKKQDEPWKLNQTEWDVTKFLKYLDSKGVEYSARLLSKQCGNNKIVIEYQFRNSEIDLQKVMMAAQKNLRNK